ncbi:MAG TPA: hypothetical protein VGF43_22315 [Dongiaceae bacterium]
MAIQDPTLRAGLSMEEVAVLDRGPAVSWGAIFAGAVAAAALSFVLLAIGAAFGLSVASPWDFGRRPMAETAAAAGIGAAIFLIVVHAVSSGVGGYLGGRLRAKTTGLRGDETYFRDTAHGLVVWAVGAVATVFLIGIIAAGAARGTVALGAAGLNAAGQAAGGAVSAVAPAAMGQGRQNRDSLGYLVDSLFRPGEAGATTAPATDATTGQATSGQTATPPATPQAGAPATLPVTQSGPDRRGEREAVGRLLRMGLDGEFRPEDKAYLVQVVAQETGLSQAEAQKRVDQVVDRAKAAKADAEQKAKEAADVARKAGMYTALWSAVAMLAGAFCASLAATWGGRARDL